MIFIWDNQRCSGIIWDQLGASGEMIARIASEAEVSTFVGSVVSLTGVCVVDADNDRRLRDVELWISELENIEVLDSGNLDPAVLSSTPLEQLDRFDSNRSLNERLRTQGTVLHWDSLGRIYIGDGGGKEFGYNRGSRNNCGGEIGWS